MKKFKKFNLVLIFLAFGLLCFLVFRKKNLEGAGGAGSYDPKPKPGYDPEKLCNVTGYMPKMCETIMYKYKCKWKYSTSKKKKEKEYCTYSP